MQIVGVIGSNPSGKLLLVEKIFTPPALPFFKSNHSSPQIPFSVVVASGPWTTTDSFGEHALDTFLDEIEKNAPELLILVSRVEAFPDN